MAIVAFAHYSDKVLRRGKVIIILREVGFIADFANNIYSKGRFGA